MNTNNGSFQVEFVNGYTTAEMSFSAADGTRGTVATKSAQELIADVAPLATFGEDGNPEFYAALELLTEAIGEWAEDEAQALGTTVTGTDSADGGLYFYLAAKAL